MLKAICRCDNVIELDLPEVINLDTDSQFLSLLAKGELLSVKCPRCDSKVHAELPITIKSSQFEFIVVPEADRLSVYRGKFDSKYSSEVLIGYQELYERCRILLDGLDPSVIEVIKYYLAVKAEESNPDADIEILYNAKNEDKLDFHVLGIDNDKTGLIRVPFSTYEKALKDIKKTQKTEPFNVVFNGKYKSYKKLGFISSVE